MAQKYITHPFIVKLKDIEEYKDYTNFNNKYFVAFKDEVWNYVTPQTYKEMQNDMNLSQFLYGFDYMCSRNDNAIVAQQSINTITNLVYSVCSSRISGYGSDGNVKYQTHVIGDSIHFVFHNDEEVTMNEVKHTIARMIRYIIADNKNIPSLNDKYDVVLERNGLSQKLTSSALNDDGNPLVDEQMWAFMMSLSMADFVNDLYDVTFNMTVTNKENNISKTYTFKFEEYCQEQLLEEQQQVVSLNGTTDIDYLPQLIIDGEFNSEYFDEEMTMQANKDFVNYYESLNYASNRTFTDEELSVLCATFCSTILDMTLIEEPLTSQNEAYKAVLEFFKNEGTDETLERFALLKGVNMETPTSCACGTADKTNGCTNSNGYSLNGNVPQQDCSDIYKYYMLNTLKNMLGDVKFYEDWIEGNDALCNMLITLLNEFKEQGYVLDFGTTKTVACPSLSSQKSECNYGVIDNYIKVLGWVNNGELLQNRNKTKSYGSAFGELLPNLMF